MLLSFGGLLLCAIALLHQILRTRWMCNRLQRARRLADASLDAVAILDGDRIHDINRRFAELTGCTAAGARGTPLLRYFPDDQEAVVLKCLHGGPAVDTRLQGVEEEIPVALTSRRHDRHHRTVSLQDLRQRLVAHAKINHLTAHDPLTDLPNRQVFTEILAQEVRHARRSDTALAVILVDIVRFGELNDRYGHRTGDCALCHLADRLRDIAGPQSQIARLAGNEFALLLSSGDGPGETANGAAILAHAVTASGLSDLLIDGAPADLSLAVGVAVFPDDGDDADPLLNSASLALKQAKRDKGSRVRFFTPGTDQAQRERYQLERDLRGAIEGDAIELYLQPQSAVASDRITGFEALARWQHPTRGHVSPAQFIAVAEQSGLISDLSDRILTRALGEAASWSQPLCISVNISPVQFDDPGFVGRIRQWLERSGLPPDRLELEITEGVLIADAERARHTLVALKRLGVAIVMDDFGTGYSSLSYLQRFPVDKLKIDREFIKEVDRNSSSLAIVRAVIGLARGIGVPVVAEGVETQAQLDILRREGCDQIQGYLLGRPQPAAAYSALTAAVRQQAVL